MRFMRFKLWYFLISAIVILPGLFSLFKWGLRPSIDFTGGTILELEFSSSAEASPFAKATEDKSEDKKEAIKETLESLKIDYSSIQSSGEKRVLIKTKSITKEDVSSIIGTLSEKVGEKPSELRFDTVGPTLGKELIKKTFFAVLLGAGFILLYVWKQFKQPMYGVCAILAMFHDSLVLLGVFSLLGHFAGVEVDTLFVTAVLTILSFSVHDTVVVYDRIRESTKKFSDFSFADLTDKAVTETLPRSINNSMTIILMLLALYLLGGSTIRWFVFALLVGTVSGTYSSTFVAAPLLVVWDEIKNKKK